MNNSYVLDYADHIEKHSKQINDSVNYALNVVLDYWKTVDVPMDEFTSMIYKNLELVFEMVLNHSDDIANFAEQIKKDFADPPYKN